MLLDAWSRIANHFHLAVFVELGTGAGLLSVGETVGRVMEEFAPFESSRSWASVVARSVEKTVFCGRHAVVKSLKLR